MARIVGVSPEIIAKVKDALRTKDVNEMKADDKPK